MLVIGYLLLWGIISFFIPRKERSKYIIFLSFVLPLLYFGFEPPNDESYDLSRYYIILDHMRRLELRDVLTGNYTSLYISMLGKANYVALIYFWVISKIGIDSFLPYITGVIAYYACFRILCDMSKRYAVSNSMFGVLICYILFTLNYGEISGVRNILAFSLTTYVLYLDFIEDRNKILCILMYALLSTLHISVSIILMFRLMLLLRKILSFRIIVVGCLIAYFLIRVIQRILSRFSTIEAVNLILEKIMGYSIRTEYNYRLVFGSLIIILFCLLLSQYSVMNNKLLFRNYYEFTACVCAAAIGGIWTDVLIGRLANLALFVSIPYAVYAMHTLVGKNLLSVRIQKKRRLVCATSLFGIYCITIFYAIFNTYYLYMKTFDYFFK